MLHALQAVDADKGEALCEACKRVVDIIEHAEGEWRCGVVYRAAIAARERHV